MNSDTFVCLRSDFPAGHPFQTAPLALASTTETAFLLSNTNVAAVAIPSQTAILGSSTPLNPNANSALIADVYGMAGDERGLVQRPYFTSTSFDGRAFRVRAQIKFTCVTTGSAPALNFKMYVGSSATLGSDTVYFTPTARTLATSQTINGNAIIEATMQWDSATQKVTGEAWAEINDNQSAGTYTARAAITPVAVAAYTGLSFVMSAVYGTNAPTSSTNTLVEFAIERV